jgi:hypothetical protein
VIQAEVDARRHPCVGDTIRLQAQAAHAWAVPAGESA